jgi:hypothetical protein
MGSVTVRRIDVRHISLLRSSSDLVLVKRFCVCLLVAVALVGACAPSEPQSTHTMRQGHWDGYATLDGLVAASDLVVRVKVIDASGYSLQPGAAKSLLNWYTDTRVAVEKVLKGSAPSEVIVLQTGLMGEPSTMWPEMPVLKPGARAVLFLKDITTSRKPEQSRATFAVVAPEGQYEVFGDRVITVVLGTPVPDAAAKLRLNEFEDAISAATR